MRYCTNCQRLTPGEPLYCNHCGRSYDVKLCPARHLNPRDAQACATCGSRELSVPQPRTSNAARFLSWMLGVVPGVLLLLLSVMVFVSVLGGLLAGEQPLTGTVLALGLILGLLWLAYLHLPWFLKGAVRGLFAGHRRPGHKERGD